MKQNILNQFESVSLKPFNLNCPMEEFVDKLHKLEIRPIITNCFEEIYIPLNQKIKFLDKDVYHQRLTHLFKTNVRGIHEVVWNGRSNTFIIP